MQHYITIFFKETGLDTAGFTSLLLVYSFFIISNPLAAIIVSRVEAEKSMIFASLFYTFFIVLLLTKSLVVVYFSSVLLGIAASLLWTAQNSYLVRMSNENAYGKNAGFFDVMLSAGSAIGVLLLGYMLSKFSFPSSLTIWSVFPVIGIILFLWIQDSHVTPPKRPLMLMHQSLTSITTLKLSTIGFAFMFIYGLVIGILPIEIKNKLGIQYVGLLSFLFYSISIAFAYVFGKSSDIKGRKLFIILSYAISICGLSLIYIAEETSVFVIGLILLAFTFAIMRPISMALVGDITDENNVEFVTAVLWMAQNIGVVSSLFISRSIQYKVLYLISIGVLTISCFITLSVFRLPFYEVRKKISQETS